jgi:hypothetical protein
MLLPFFNYVPLVWLQMRKLLSTLTVPSRATGGHNITLMDTRYYKRSKTCEHKKTLDINAARHWKTE